MKETLKPGIEAEFTIRIPESKTVSALYPESPEFQEMPEVFATGYLVGLLEWTCIRAVNPHLNWPQEQTVGTHIDVNHIAATPVGFDVTAKVKLIEGDGMISKGRHDRFVINKDKFDSNMKKKTSKRLS